MRKASAFALATCALVIGAWGASRSYSSEEASKGARIFAQDLCEGKYEIIGRLDKPYGDVLKVRGVWEQKNPLQKGSEFNLRITEVDGVKLERGVLFDEAHVYTLGRGHDSGAERKDGMAVECRGFERGGYISNPPAVDEILGNPPVQTNITFRFYSFLYLIDAR